MRALAALAAATLLLGARADAPPPGDLPEEAMTAARQPYPTTYTNTSYDGHFTFARIKFTPNGGAMFSRFGGAPDVKWNHDFPRAETHFMSILEELTTLRPTQGGGNVFGWDEPEVMRYPLAYQCEVGFWAPSEAEAAGMRAYFAKGGFVIFDDFSGARAWETFVEGIRRVLPEARLVQLTPDHAIFDAFFKVDMQQALASGGTAGFGGGGFGGRGGPEFWGAFEDNDPSKRLLFIANYNNDIGEGWEWSDTGAFPVDVTSTTYKLGVNYLMYGMTH